MIKSMDLAWITVSDFQRAKTFYTETLGLTLRSGAPEYSWMELVGKDGGMALGVGGDCGTDQNPVKPGQNAVMTMTVDDIVATKAALEAKGVQFFGDIIEVPGHVKMALFADPDGNKLQLVQMLSMN